MKRDGMERIWSGSERHIGDVAFAMNGTCHNCHTAPAHVYLERHVLCGVCWNKVMWLRWAKDTLRG